MKIISAIIILISITIPAYATIGDIIRAFPTPGPCPTGLTSDGKNLILADRKTDKIYVLSPESGEIIGSFEAPGYRPYGLAYDSAYLWMVDAEENVIIQINLQTKINIKTISSPAAGPSGLAWDGKYLWLADTQAGKLMQVSTEDGTTVKELVAPSSSPNAITFDGTYLWVADRMEDKIYMVWPSTGEVIMMFKSPGQYTNGLAILNNQLYCADYQTDSIYVIAIDDNKNCLIQDPVRLTLEYTDQFRNYGPGTVLDLAIYLALPQDSPHQTIIEPPVFPDNSKYDIITDKWGQKIARFQFDTVQSGQVVQASYKVVADIFDLWFLIRPEKVGSFKEIPKEIKDKYLMDDTKFAITSPTIRDAKYSAMLSII
jgi:DNA-binding beta-propeller fold protein YncE